MPTTEENQCIWFQCFMATFYLKDLRWFVYLMSEEEVENKYYDLFLSFLTAT